MLGQSTCFWIWRPFLSSDQPSEERWKPQFDELQIKEQRALCVSTFQKSPQTQDDPNAGVRGAHAHLENTKQNTASTPEFQKNVIPRDFPSLDIPTTSCRVCCDLLFFSPAFLETLSERNQYLGNQREPLRTITARGTLWALSHTSQTPTRRTRRQGRWEAREIVLDARIIPTGVQTQPEEKKIKCQNSGNWWK